MAQTGKIPERSALAGTRIRALRMARRMAQADLARAAGVSASYLNLIEHNRRRAGPPVLAAIAAALQIPADTLDEGAGDRLVEAVRAAVAQAAVDPAPELDRAEDLVGRYPGWAGLLAALGARAEAQERVIERLSDRMAHDPNLSAALHEIVSAVTAVQSSSAILVETADIEPRWRDRFHANIHDDSRRLSTAAEALVAYLDSAAEETGLAAPLEEMESWLARQGFHIPALEADADPDPAALTRDQPELASQAARQMARDWLVRARADARALPLNRLMPALGAMCAERAFSPGDLARQFGVSLAVVLRRLAALPAANGPGLSTARFGLVICDGSGTLIFRRPIDGFALPRFGGGCPIWPLYQALMQPLRPLRCLVETATRPQVQFVAHALAESAAPAGFDGPVVWQALMLLSPPSLSDTAGLARVGVGSSCRVCPRGDCIARREPSIVAG